MCLSGPNSHTQKFFLNKHNRIGLAWRAILSDTQHINWYKGICFRMTIFSIGGAIIGLFLAYEGIWSLNPPICARIPSN